MMFNINDYRSKYVMHLKTREELDDFSRVLDGMGKRWFSGHSYIELNYWEDNGHNTCYNFNEGKFGDIWWYRNNGYIILEWSDYMNNKFTKADLRDGDVCVSKNGEVNIVNLNATMFMVQDGWNDMNDINDDLVFKNDCYNEFNIVRVYRPSVPYQCSFNSDKYTSGTVVYDRDRDETVKMTVAEVCKALGKNVEIIK